MQGMIDDGLAVIMACLVIAAAASALILLRPRKRRHRHRRRHSRQPKIDLFKAGPSDSVSKVDA
jgi:uncharacterized iron-regulated membrane protein